MSKDNGKAVTVDAWHWLRTDSRLNYPPHQLIASGTLLDDPRDNDGDPGPIDLCNRGYHASIRALDALQYAPGPIICRVRLSGEFIHGDDKLCASRREVLWMADATTTLRLFGCDAAEAALTAEREQGREPDARSWEAFRMMRAWMLGKVSDEELDAARSAASSAASSAAWSAASSAAWSAAWSAARSAAWSAARSAHNEMLETRLYQLQEATEAPCRS